MFIMGVLALGLGISLVQNGLSAFDELDEWGPLLIVGILFGLPFGHSICANGGATGSAKRWGFISHPRPRCGAMA